MISSVSLIKKASGVKCTHIDDVETVLRVKKTYNEDFEQEIILVHARPWKRIQRLCPICHQACPGYDTKREEESQWRGPNINGMPAYFCYAPNRIECPVHGVKTEYIPWQDGQSRCIASFNDEVTYLALEAPKSVVAEYLGINWRTVGNCINACHKRLEPDPKKRFEGVRRICVDETSYKKGHKYITVVVDMDRNTVIWLHDKHGDEIFEQFCLELTEEQRKQITIVAGDGAQWIDRKTKDYFPNARRCIDPFHSVGWVMEALDTVRKSLYRSASYEANKERTKMEEEAEQARLAWMLEYEKYIAAVDELNEMAGRRGRKSEHLKELEAFVSQFEDQYGETMDLLRKQKKGTLTEEQKARLDELDKKAACIKGCKYVLGMNPENLNDYNHDRLELIKASNPDAYEAYRLKEVFRTIVHMRNPHEAKKALEEWIEMCQKSNFEPFKAVADKIKGRIPEILNSVETGCNSSRSEQTNGMIKGLIKTANGFANLENLFALIYLQCSDIVIPLANRYRPSSEKVKEKREHAARKRKEREEAKKQHTAA